MNIRSTMVIMMVWVVGCTWPEKNQACRIHDQYLLVTLLGNNRTPLGKFMRILRGCFASYQRYYACIHIPVPGTCA